MAAMAKANWPADGLTLGLARQRLIDPALLARYERAESLARERAWGAEMIRDLELRRVNAEFFERLERGQYRIDGCPGPDAERANVPASELRRWKIDWHQNTATDAAGTLWRDLRVWRTAASASEPAPDQAAAGGEDTQTGDGPGRPAVVDAYIRPEAERLINSGEVKPTKGGLASFSRPQCPQVRIVKRWLFRCGTMRAFTVTGRPTARGTCSRGFCFLLWRAPRPQPSGTLAEPRSPAGPRCRNFARDRGWLADETWALHQVHVHVILVVRIGSGR